MPLDPKQVFPHQPVQAVKAWGVYADYDGNSPDSDDVILLSDPELADEVRKLIENSYDYLCVSDGHEWSKAWRVRETLGSAEATANSLEQAIAWLGEPDEDNDGDDDDGEWS